MHVSVSACMCSRYKTYTKQGRYMKTLFEKTEKAHFGSKKCKNTKRRIQDEEDRMTCSVTMSQCLQPANSFLSRELYVYWIKYQQTRTPDTSVKLNVIPSEIEPPKVYIQSLSM